MFGYNIRVVTPEHKVLIFIQCWNVLCDGSQYETWHTEMIPGLENSKEQECYHWLVKLVKSCSKAQRWGTSGPLCFKCWVQQSLHTNGWWWQCVFGVFRTRDSGSQPPQAASPCPQGLSLPASLCPLSPGLLIKSSISIVVVSGLSCDVVRHRGGLQGWRPDWSSLTSALSVS